MFNNQNDRRDFLKKISLAGAASVITPAVFAGPTELSGKKISIKEGDTILFQGDSITDAGRKKEAKDAAMVNNPGALGTGYAVLTAAELLKGAASKKLKIYNRGISGNKVYQLADRWEADCIALQPNVLSILIGVNDFWHKLNGNYSGTVEKYKTDYDALLTRTKYKLPDVKLIICEPFAVKGVRAVDDKWYPEFDGYRAAARELADKYGAVFVPYQSVFDKAQKTAPGSWWTGDGVHPSLAGAQLMAAAWLQAVKL